MSYETINDNNLRLYDERFPNPQEIALEATFVMPGNPDDFAKIPIRTARQVAETLLSTLPVVSIDPKTILIAAYNGLAAGRDEAAAHSQDTVSIYDSFSEADLVFASYQQRDVGVPGERYRFMTAYNLLSNHAPIQTAGTSRGARLGVYSQELLAKAGILPLDASQRQRPLEVYAKSEEVARARVLRFTPRYVLGIERNL
jgi:hypothetical protein